MGRTKEFKEAAVLSKAAHVFWKRGYENASLKELLDEMEILNGSFYHSYRNKKNLFIAALNSYEKDFSDRRVALFKSTPEFKKNLRSLFRLVFDRQRESVCPRGCFLFNSVSSETVADVDIFKLVRKGIEAFESFLEAEIKNAIQMKEVDSSVDAKTAAAVLIAYMQGMMNLSVLDYDDVTFRAQTEYFLTALGL